MAPVKIYKIDPRPIPSALQSLPEYQDLSGQQRSGFAERLQYIEEITKKIDEWTTGVESDLRAFIDRIELDLYINVGAPLPGSGGQASSWLVHSSWSAELTPQDLRKALPPQLAVEIDRALPSFNSDLDETTQWMEVQNNALKRSLTGFYEAVDLRTVITYLHAIDIVLASILVCSLKTRLNLAFE